MDLLTVELNEEEMKLKERILNLPTFVSNDEFMKQEAEKLANKSIKTFGLAINEFSDFTLSVFLCLFEEGDKQIEHLFIGIGSKRGVTNAANALVRRGYCYWDMPDASSAHLGYTLCIDKSKFITEDYAYLN